MTDWLQRLAHDLANTQWLELVAVVFAIAYVLLAARQIIWCWLCAIISTALFVVVYYEVQLLSEALLNIYYLLIAIYGWILWRQGGAQRGGTMPVQRWPWHRHVIAIGISCLFVPVLAFWTIRLGAKLPYIDAATTCFAVLATFLVTRKVLENWLYWIGIYVHAVRGLAMTSLLFVIYVVLAVYGYYQWQLSYRLTQSSNS